MITRCLFVGLAAVALLTSIARSPAQNPEIAAPTTPPGVCQPAVVELDTALWNGAAGTFLGRAVGQTFYAPETLLSGITLWRPPGPNSLGGHLYITEVDEGWSPPRPNTREILLNGPTVEVFDSDPPGQLVAMRYMLDPPLALPRRGLYAFFIQAEFCNPGEIRLVADSLNPYPGGMYWITGRALTVCALAPVAGGGDNIDLIFRLEFCDATTPVRRKSWGQLKSIYR